MWKSEDDVRLWNGPSLHEVNWRGHVFQIALRRAAIGPGRNGVDLLLGKRAVIGKLAIMWIGIPRRHLFQHDRFLHGLRPGPRLLIGEKRKWRCFAWAVACLAVLLQ